MKTGKSLLKFTNLPNASTPRPQTNQNDPHVQIAVQDIMKHLFRADMGL